MTTLTFVRTQKNELLPYVILALGIVCISFAPIFVRVAGVPGVVSAFYRAFIATIIVVPWAWMRPRQRLPRREIMIVVGGGVFFAVDLVFWNSSVLLTSIATASLLSNSAPLWVGLGALLLFHEHLSFRYWCGLVIAICGMTILLGLEAWQGFHLNNGNFLALIAGGFYAGYILTTQRARQRFDTVTFMAVSGISSVIVLLAINLLMGTALWGFSNRTWLALLGIGLVSHLSGWLAINYALGHLRAAPVSVSLLGQVILSSLLAIPLFGESLNLHQILGGVAVLSGIYLANQRKSVKGEMKGNRWGGGKGNQ